MKLGMNYRFISILVLIIASLFTIFSPFLTRTQGVIVTSVGSEASCNNVQVGDRIIYVGGELIADSSKFKSVESGVRKDVYVAMKVNTGPGGCTAPRDGFLGIQVADVKSDFLKFGVDVGGGFDFIIKSESVSSGQLEETNKIIQKRISLLLLNDFRSRIENEKIIITAPDSEQVNDLISEGKIEVLLTHQIKVENVSGQTKGLIRIGSNSYDILLSGKTLTVNGINYSADDYFVIEGVKIRITNQTSTSITVEQLIFTNEDLSTTTVASSFVTFEQQQNAFEFSVPFELSEEDEKRLINSLKGLTKINQAGTIVLDGLLVYKIDNKEVSKLAIPGDFESQNLRVLSIVGFTASSQTAEKMMKYISTILSSGPHEILLSIDSSIPIQAEHFSLLVLVSTGTVLFVFIFTMSLTKIRYKKLKFSGFVLFALISEFIILLGFVNYVQRSFGTMTIDLVTVFSMIAIVFLNVLDSVLVAEEKVKLRGLNVRIGGRNIMKSRSLFRTILIIVGFALLFSGFRNSGVLILVWFIIRETLTRSYLLKKLL